MSAPVDLAAFARVLAQHAADVDAGRWDRVQIVHQLRQQGLLKTPFSGTSDALSMAEMVSALEVLGRGCVSSALALAMHWVSILYMTRFVPPLDGEEDAHLKRLLSMILATRADLPYVANCYGEPGSGAHIAGAETRARRDGAGWRISGCKFGSFADAADLLQIHCRVDEDPHAGTLLQFVCRRDTTGISIEILPPTVGVRAAGPLLVRFEDVYVNDAWRFGPPDLFHAAGAAFPLASLLLVAPYVGLAEAAVEAAVSHARDRKVGADSTPLLRTAAFRNVLAGTLVRLESARALMKHAAADDLVVTPKRRFLINAARVAVAKVVPRVCADMMHACGVRGLMEHTPFGRFLRDAQAVWAHSPSIPEAHECIVEDVSALDYLSDGTVI